MNDDTAPEPFTPPPPPGSPPSAAYHRSVALEYARRVENSIVTREELPPNANLLLRLAQVHATLALVAQNEEAHDDHRQGRE